MPTEIQPLTAVKALEAGRLPDPCLGWRPITRDFGEIPAQPQPGLSGKMRQLVRGKNSPGSDQLKKMRKKTGKTSRKGKKEGITIY